MEVLITRQSIWVTAYLVDPSPARNQTETETKTEIPAQIHAWAGR